MQAQNFKTLKRNFLIVKKSAKLLKIKKFKNKIYIKLLLKFCNWVHKKF